MSVIWIIETAAATETSLAAALIGDFAVRAFASLASFSQLLRLSRSQLPDLLLIDSTVSDGAGVKLTRCLEEHLPKTPVVYVTAADAAPGPAAFTYRRPVESLALSAYLHQILLDSAALDQRSVVRFRSVSLDYQKLECLAGPGGEAFSLPRKEAQLLRLLLLQPGVCFSREEIQERLWQDVSVTPRTVDSHVSRLRRRLSGAEVEIVSVYGGGYVLR